MSALSVVSGPELAMRTADGNRPFSLSLGTTSVFEALNAIARAHGALAWEVKYCMTPSRPELAQVMFFTHENDGIGTHLIQPLDAQGRRYAACTSPPKR